MKKSKLILYSFAISFFVIFISACSNSSNSTTNDSNSEENEVEEVTLGAVVPLTGPNAAWGQQTWNGFQLAAKMINESGGIESLGGAKLNVVVADTESQPTVAGAQTEKLAQQGVSALIGTNQSSASLVATQVAERQQIPFIIGADVEPSITERGFKYTFRTIPLIDSYGKDILQWVKEMGERTGKKASKVAFLSENSEVGLSANEHGVAAAEELGFEVVEVIAFEPSTQDFTAYLKQIKEKEADVVLGFSNPPEGVQITRGFKVIDYNPMIFAGMLGGQSSIEYVDALGADANYVIATSAWSPELEIEGLDEISKRFEEEYGVQFDSTAAAGFSTMAVIWEGLEQAGSSDPKKLRDAIANVELETGERMYLQLDGVKFNEKGDNEKASGVLQMIRDKDWIPVYPSEYAKEEYPWPKPEWGSE